MKLFCELLIAIMAIIATFSESRVDKYFSYMLLGLLSSSYFYFYKAFYLGALELIQTIISVVFIFLFYQTSKKRAKLRKINIYVVLLLMVIMVKGAYDFQSFKLNHTLFQRTRESLPSSEASITMFLGLLIFSLLLFGVKTLKGKKK